MRIILTIDAMREYLSMTLSSIIRLWNRDFPRAPGNLSSIILGNSRIDKSKIVVCPHIFQIMPDIIMEVAFLTLEHKFSAGSEGNLANMRIISAINGWYETYHTGFPNGRSTYTVLLIMK